MDTSLRLALCAAFVLAACLLYAGGAGSDLLAVRLAGEAFAEGAPLYPGDVGAFTMLPPDGWAERAAAIGHEGATFPFLYPPLWAWAAGPLTTLPFETLRAAALPVNAALLAAAVALAARLAARRLSRTTFLALDLALLLPISPVALALMQGQAQMLVTVLVLLAFEREARGHPALAGAALALAASIKLYPLFFALFWMLRGRRSAATAFLVVGAALAALSLAVAGWPAHRAFLDQITAISSGVFVAGYCFTIDWLLGATVLADRLTFVPGLSPELGWFTAPKPAALAAVSSLAPVAAVLVLSRLPRDPLTLPVLAVVIGALSPIAWSYHYLTALVFVPALIDRLGARAAVPWLAVVLGPQMLVVASSGLPAYWANAIGLLAMLTLAAALLRTMTRPGRAPVARGHPAPA